MDNSIISVEPKHTNICVRKPAAWLERSRSKPIKPPSSIASNNLNKMDTLSITQGLFKRTILPSRLLQSLMLYHSLYMKMELGQFHTRSNLKSVIFNKPEFLIQGYRRRIARPG